MKVNRLFIEECKDNGELKELAFFLYLKGKWSNSVITNFTQDKIGLLADKGRGYGRARAKFMLKENWADINLVNGKEYLNLKKCSRLDSLKKKIWINLQIQGKSIKEIYSLLILQILKHKKEQAEWYSKTCADLRKLHGKQKRSLERRVFKKYENFRTKGFVGAAGTKGFKVSFKKLAQWFNCSVGMAHSIMTDLKARGLIEVFKECVYLGDKAGLFKGMAREYGWFVSGKKYLFKVECNQYVF